MMKACLLVTALILSLSICSLAPAADQFTANTLGDHGNVTVMEVTGNYDARKSDGSVNSAPRQAIAKEFYRLHKDEYDFLVIFTNFDFIMPETDAAAFYTGVKNDTQGIGRPLFDNSSTYGSNSKLQGTIDMGSILNLAMDPLDPGFEETLDTISHEMMHRWATYVKFKDALGNLSPALLGKDGSHWSFLLSTDASLMYGNTWQDNGNGTFTSVKGRKYYSPLDLYLMGFMDKSQVPPMLLIDNPDIDPKRVSEMGVTISGTPRYITIDDIIAAEGERNPGPLNSQKTFKTAFIFITAPGTYSGDEIYGLENIRNGWLTRYSVLTDGAGLVQVASIPKDNIPVNPGIQPPVTTPRPLPADVVDGVKWLMANQKEAGNWADLAQTARRDTAETVQALKGFDMARKNADAGVQWLSVSSQDTTDYLARKTEAMLSAGQDVNSLLTEIISRQNRDGGWGSANRYASNPVDAGLVLKVLGKAGYAGQPVISKAIEYLKAKQNTDGGWGNEEGGRVETTVHVLTAFNKYAASYALNEQIAAGSSWLLQRQNPDGGFGNSPSTIYDTALAAMTLAELGTEKDSRNNALAYIRGHQSGDGSWNESPYQTALAVQAIYKDNIDPDLSVMNTDISFMPPTITNYPSTIEVSAAVSNLGTTAVPLAKVVLYDGAMVPANKISEQTSAFPGLSSVAMKFAVTVTDAREHTYYIAVDPDNLIKESDETNNTASNKLESSINYDFEILPADLTFSLNPVDISKDMKIAARISNRGRYNAYNVHVKYYIDEPGAPFDMGTSTIDIPAGATVTNEITWKTNKSGADLPVAVYIDPFNEFDEVTKANNKAVALLTVKGSTDPNLTVSYRDIAINPTLVNEGANAAISAVIMNTGFSAASNIVVNFYLGNPGTDGVLLGTKTISALNAGDSTTITADWSNIGVSGTNLVYVKADPDSLIKETTKDDNDAFVAVQVLSLPDLAISTNSILFNPAAPRDGDTVSINVMIKNLGEQTASNVLVRIYDGSNLIDSRTVSVIEGNSQAAVVFSYDTAGKSGAHQMTVKVDPDNAIIERSKDNNTAANTFGVQNANLWLTEPYISPNGDGVKDSTQFFFGMPVPQTVKLQIVNEKGETVRTYDGTDLENISGGNITWDGLNDNGTVVGDGQYQLKVVGTNSNIIGSLLVTVDNNMSSLTKAIGTKYLLNNNLTCMLPDVTYRYGTFFAWLPDESGAVFSFEDTSYAAPEYPNSIYTMAPDGEDIQRILPQDWNDSNPDGHYIEYMPHISPDGEKVAFTFWKYDYKTRLDTMELWVVDRDGRHLTFVTSVLWGPGSYNARIYSVKWSQDSSFVSYIKMSGDSSDLWLYNARTSEGVMIDSEVWYYGDNESQWSQDSTEIAYQGWYCDQNQACRAELRISDTTGTKKTVADWAGDIFWLDNKKILSSTYNNVRILDTSVNAQHIEILSGPARLIDPAAGNQLDLGGYYANLSLSPDRKTILVIESFDKTVAMQLFDSMGNSSLAYQVPLVEFGYGEGIWNNITGIAWSVNGKKIAFVDYAYNEIDKCIYEPALIIIDVSTKEKTVLKLLNSEYVYKYWDFFYVRNSSCADYSKYRINNNVGGVAAWLDDNENLLLFDNSGYFNINVKTGERGGYLPGVTNISGLSPLGRYITHTEAVDQSSACYGRGSSDIWAMSSLLNLTADLRLIKNRSSVVLKGIAADLNFEGYKLEYADVKNPANWSLIQPPADTMVINDTFTTWVPPSDGTFYVRVTVWDKAGNVAVDRKRLSWGATSAIINLYKSTGIFSPNNDGIKDTVSLNYTVLEPVHLEFSIYDSQGTAVKTFLRDYTSAGADSVTWDGRDSSGNIAPDGIYIIKIFDYEFPVEVDNTAPKAHIGISGIIEAFLKATTVDSQYEINQPYFIDIKALAFDTNMMHWSVEYGKGANPTEWFKYAEGMTNFVKTDEHSGTLSDAILGEEWLTVTKRTDDIFNIASYDISSGIGLEGSRFRITVEDMAGNRSSSVSGLNEERVYLYEWDDHYAIRDVIPARLSAPGKHYLGAFHTIRGSIASAAIQYSRSYNSRLGVWSDWTDAIDISFSNNAFFEWDTTSLNLGKVYGVRLKYTDTNGIEHYSNILHPEKIFTMEVLCKQGIAGTVKLQAINSVFDKQRSLKFQVRSDADIRYNSWTDIDAVVDNSDFNTATHAFEGDAIPIDDFFAYIPAAIFMQGYTYELRMIGLIDDRNIDLSVPVNYPPKKCGADIELSIDYKEAECGRISGQATLGAKVQIDSDFIIPEAINYYLDRLDGRGLIKTSDLAIDTTGMAEGYYPVKAVLTYRDLGAGNLEEVSDIGGFIVDRTLPTAGITYPGKSKLVCPMKIADKLADWFAIPVEGATTDNIGIRKDRGYSLYYGIGNNPESWVVAKTRKGINKVPIEGGTTIGPLGNWDVTDLRGTDYSLMLKAVDITGNAFCETTNFSIDTLIEIASLSTDKRLFSPNGDGVMDDVRVDYQIGEPAMVDVKVFRLTLNSDGKYIPDPTAVRTVITNSQHIEGIESVSWDGNGDSGTPVPDGIYGITVFATDSCGNSNSRFAPVEVDTTHPSVLISYPVSSATVSNVVEIRGTAQDLHFSNYLLEAASADKPDEWHAIAASPAPAGDGVLGTWNTYGLKGVWTIRLTAYDRVGNSSATSVTVNIGDSNRLIKNLSAQPALFSPNNDGRHEATAINYEVTGACVVTLRIMDAGGVARRTYTTSVFSPGIYTFVWDGRNDVGVTVQDGVYSVQLSAAPSADSAVTESVLVSVTVDTATPSIDIRQPANNSFLNSASVTVSGSITDAHLSSYTITFAGEAGALLLDSGNQGRTDYIFGTNDNLADVTYSVIAHAEDGAGNSVDKTTTFTIDRTPPKITLDTPKDSEIYGNAKNVIAITGGVVEKNLDIYSIRYGLGNNPSQWTELLAGNSVPGIPQLFNWKVGKSDGIADGLYTLSLYAKDRAGLTGEKRAAVVIDNTPPEVALISPKDGDYLKTAAEIKGTAFDSNLRTYTLEISEGACTTAFKWAPLRIAATVVQDGLLGSLQSLPSDGNYCLRLTAVDKVDNSSQTMVNIKLDTLPPAPPVLSGRVENRKDSRLTWTVPPEPDVAGYDVYRDGQKINAAMIHDTQYLDQSLEEKVYIYVVKAIDLAGNESKPSNEIKLKIDLTGPDAKIRSPQDGAVVSNLVDIKGSAYSQDDFKEYRIYIGTGSEPSFWQMIRTSPVPTSYGALAQWDTLSFSDGVTYSIKLEAEDLSGNINAHQLKVVPDNTPPSTPVLLSAVPNISDVSISWKANSETDLVGYLLYRGDQLVNVSGIVSGNLAPYLINGTGYLDKAVSDGKYKYYLIGMDKAGNMSDQSNMLEVSIDTHPPHMMIVEPLDRSKFDKKILVKGDTPDIDIASVQFQFKKATDTTWINLGSPVSKYPYTVFLDPATLGLDLGDYFLRAVATDLAGNTDSAPASIVVTYQDITPPATTSDLKAKTAGDSVTLLWSAGSEADLDGYNVYRAFQGSRTKLNATVIKDSVYYDNGLSDGGYSYEITVVDKTGNESNPSNRAMARVYAPFIAQPYTPLDNPSVRISGGNAAGGSSVELILETSSDDVSSGTVQADAEGNFAFDFTLTTGENRLKAHATDNAGNVSRNTEMVVVTYAPPPARPVGLIAVVQNKDVSLSWSGNSETDIAGYNLYRDGSRLNTSLAVTTMTGSGWPSFYYPPSNALDGNPATSWWSAYAYGNFVPGEFYLTLTSRELINRIGIQWTSEQNAGKDFEIQAWSGHDWIPIRKVTGNTATANQFDIRPPYRTDELRFLITDTTDSSYGRQVGIADITLLKDNPIPVTEYNDTGLHDGSYSYQVSAVNYYGFESPNSDEAKADVGDVTAPSAPENLSATVSGLDVSLNWTANTEPDIAGYNVYRNLQQGWSRLNAGLIQTTTYTDSGMPNGNYTYRVTAVDIAGNESLPSNEALAVVDVPDTLAPSKPVLVFPTLSGLAVILHKDKTDIVGLAEPDSTVEIFRNAESVGATSTPGEDQRRQYRKEDGTFGEYLSPDGTKLIYTLNDAVWLKDLTSGAATLIAGSAVTESWSGESFLYYIYDSNSNYHLYVYDTTSGISTPLGEDASADEYSPSWSPDGKLVAFTTNRNGTYDIWLKDLSSGLLSQITSGRDVNYVRFSPDGKRLLYADGQGLFIYDLANGSVSTVDDGAVSYAGEWSPDGNLLLYTDYRTGNAEPVLVDLNTYVKAQAASINGDIYYITWSPDGSSVYLGIWDGADYSILIKPVEGEATVMREAIPWLSSLAWTKTGYLTIGEQLIFNVIQPKGYFRFEEVNLDAGDNFFVARATDASSNLSQPSDPIVVTYDVSSVADLETTSEDIYPYPDVPVSGHQLAVNVAVWNRGVTAVKSARADIYISDVNGNVALIKSTVIPNIDPGSAEIVGGAWDTTGNIGLNSIIVVLDPQGKITEKTKDNNYAVREFFVVANEGISMTTLLNNNQLKSNEDLRIDLTLINSGSEKAGTLDVTVEDEQGNPVALLKNAAIQSSYGYQEDLVLTWNAGVTYAGLYNVHAVFKNSEGVLAENVVPFAVLPDISVGSSLITDKARYTPNEVVSLVCTLENRSANYITPAMQADLRVADASNNSVFTESRDLSSMMPGSIVNFSSAWGSSLSPAGMYTISVDVYLEGKLVSNDSAVIEIQSVPLISGSIQATAQPISPGTQVVAAYSVTNSGNSDAAVMGLRVLVIDPETQTVMHSHEEVVTVTVNGTLSGQAVFSTQGYGLKTYIIMLQAVMQGSARNIASTSFVVQDSSAPAVSIHAPVSGTYYQAQFDLSVTARDDGSGIDSVQYQVDHGVWRLLPVVDLSSGRYATSWLPVPADEGSHTINFRATDRAGNVSVPVSASITIDVTPPALIVSTLSDGSWTNSEILNIAGTITDNFGIQEFAVNGTVIQVNPDGTFSCPLVLSDGANEIAILATDRAGNETKDVRTINLDRTAPSVTVLAPADNIKTKQTPLNLTGMVDEQSSVTIRINGADPVSAVVEGNSFSLPVMLEYGVNTLEVTATDRAGNTSSAKRTVMFDDRNPSLAIIDPATDIKTNMADLILVGEVQDLTAIEVMITMDGNMYVPVITGSSFALPLTFTGERVYQIFVKAIDEAGNESVVQRNVLYDATAPVVTLDAVTSPTSMASQEIGGSVEAGAVVSVASPTVDVGVITYPTPGTWTATLTNMVEGPHVIAVTAADDVGNIGKTITAEIVVDLTPPAVTIAAPVNGTGYGGAVDIAAMVTDTGSGVGSAEYQIDGGIWNPLSVADPASNMYAALWRPLLTDEGTHAISFRAVDRLGLMSSPVSVTITIDLLSGTVKAAPDPVSRGLEETLSYTITNASSGDAPGLNVKLVILDPVTGETKLTYDAVISVPANTTFSGSVKAPTKDLLPKTYTVMLQVSGAGLPQPVKELSGTTFEVKASLEIEKTVPNVRNVLVWINDGCYEKNEESAKKRHETGSGYLYGDTAGHDDDDRCQDDGSQDGDDSSGGADECGKCIRRDLVERALGESAASHFTVYAEKDFQGELRNPYYTDMVILGNKQPMERHYWQELREKVNAGVGLVASLWMRPATYDRNGAEDPILGIRYKGRLSGRSQEVRTVQSPVTATGRIDSKGIAQRIEATQGTVIAGWFETGECKGTRSRTDDRVHECDDRDSDISSGSPAIVLNRYGKGRAVFHAFDIGATLNDNTYAQMAALIKDSLLYVHSSSADTFGPGSLVPVEIRIKSPGSAFDLKAAESYPAGIRLYDPTTMAWITENPWTSRLHLGEGEVASILFYALMPDRGGTYALKTEVSYLENGTYKPYKSILEDLVVVKDLRTSVSDILRALDELNAGSGSEIQSARKKIQFLLRHDPGTRQALEADIRSVASAINYLLRVNADTVLVRAMMDELLKGLESSYYFGF